MFHYTNKKSMNAIRSQPTWCFKASQPPCGNPFGAYFTTLEENAPLLARRLRIPKTKLEFVFVFVNDVGLRPLRGDRGEFIRYSPNNYSVVRNRQQGEPRQTKLGGAKGGDK